MLKKTAALEQPTASALIPQLRQQTGLTRESFTVVLRVTYTTVNHWKSGRMQPSPLAFKQIQATLNEIISYPCLTQQQNLCQKFLEQDFPRDYS